MSRKRFTDPRALFTLALLAAGMGITGLLYARNAGRVQEVSYQEEILETVAAAKPKATAPAETTQPTAPSTEAPKPRTIRTSAPVEGRTIGEYAMECLSYNETTRDWRTHNGIDLAAEEGTPVMAAAEGTVWQVFEDDIMGYTVAIRHEGGYTTQYSNLSDALCVKPGDMVSLGQTIGYVGTSALIETAMGSHVHFSVSYHDSPMAPEDFLALG